MGWRCLARRLAGHCYPRQPAVGCRPGLEAGVVEAGERQDQGHLAPLGKLAGGPRRTEDAAGQVEGTFF